MNQTFLPKDIGKGAVVGLVVDDFGISAGQHSQVSTCSIRVACNVPVNFDVEFVLRACWQQLPDGCCPGNVHPAAVEALIVCSVIIAVIVHTE